MLLLVGRVLLRAILELGAVLGVAVTGYSHEIVNCRCEFLHILCKLAENDLEELHEHE